MAKAKNDEPVEEAPVEEAPKEKAPKAKELKDKQHVKMPNFREAVHGKPLKSIEDEYGITPLDPYPIGSPPTPEELYYEIHGFYPAKGE